ncbi:MAG TPA: hypothetical protein PLO56_15435 [Rhodothermales bacterium]|nr:hypothetical protein [Rhodothermales bacterium]
MEDKLQAFRQPLVTATGIILGFILNFASSWVKTESPLDDMLAYFVGVAVLIGTISLIIVLYRILNMSYPRDASESYYHKTLRLFIFGVGMAYTGVLVDMFANFMHD